LTLLLLWNFWYGLGTFSAVNKVQCQHLRSKEAVRRYGLDSGFVNVFFMV